MITRGQNFEKIPLNIVGSSVFGRYNKISTERTTNMFISDTFLVPYAGYQIALTANQLSNGVLGKEGRGIFSSIKFERLVVVVDENVFLVSIYFNQQIQEVQNPSIIFIGTLETVTGIVYITENNAPQILISDNVNLYVYDPNISSTIQIVPGLSFVPGYVTYHDTYFICAVRQDNFYTPPHTNTWRLSNQEDGTVWGNASANIGFLESKPDNVQAVVRFPSKGNMIFVMGSITTEAWFDTGAQLFPYQRNNQFNIDYGCLSPASVAYMDEIVVWLASNEKSGPIIMYSDGGMPKKITTDGIDYLFSQLQNPQDSQGFLYRQDGHLFYHINFYSDNLSLFYDFNTEKFYNATDQNGNYFIAAEIAFYGNQYYFVSRNTGNMYAFDTSFTTYQDVESYPKTNQITYTIPRNRICKNIRRASQDYFILNDIGHTIESGETDYNIKTTSPNNTQWLIPPIAYLSLSYDGGVTFSNEVAYNLPTIGQRRNRLMWWQCGMSNDIVAQFRYVSIGRIVCTEGEANVRV